MRRTACTALYVGSIAVALAIALLAADAQDKPSDVGLSERTIKRLVQLDVTVVGPKGAIEGLSGPDFQVRIDHKLVSNVIVDDFCRAQPSSPVENAAESTVQEQAAREAPADLPR